MSLIDICLASIILICFCVNCFRTTENGGTDVIVTGMIAIKFWEQNLQIISVLMVLSYMIINYINLNSIRRITLSSRSKVEKITISVFFAVLAIGILSMEYKEKSFMENNIEELIYLKGFNLEGVYIILFMLVIIKWSGIEDRNN